MQIIKRKEKIGNVMFLIGIAIEILIMMTDHSAITLPYRGRFAQIAFALFGYKIATTNYSRRQWIVIVLFGLLGSISYFTCGDEYVLRAIVLIFAAKSIDKRKTLNMIFFSAIIGTGIILILSLSGIMGQTVDIRNYGRGIEEIRWCLGFNHANNLHDMFWYILVLYLYINYQKFNINRFICFTIANFVLYYFTVSRTGLLCVEITLLGTTMLFYLKRQNKQNKQKWPYLFSTMCLFICLFLTAIGGLYGIERSRLVNTVDRYLTGRLEMIWEYAPLAKWSLFPKSNSLLYVDNGFAWFFYGYGIIMGSTYILLILYMIYIFYREDKGIENVIIVSVILVTFMEATFIFNTSILCNFLFILLFNNWYQKDTRGAEI